MLVGLNPGKQPGIGGLDKHSTFMAEKKTVDNADKLGFRLYNG